MEATPPPPATMPTAAVGTSGPNLPRLVAAVATSGRDLGGRAGGVGR
jgi:hypothetical protein